MKHAAANYAEGTRPSLAVFEPGQDLFGFADRYPNAPAARGCDTSRAAAEGVRGRAESLREKVLAEIERGPRTADEVAAALRESVLTIRPRVAELHASGRIADSGDRRPNASGHKAVVWAAVDGPKF